MASDEEKKYFLFTCDIEYAGPNTENGVHQLLDLLEAYNAKGTFFTTYRIVREYPGLIELVKGQGHEIASHGYSHPYIEKDFRYLNNLSEVEIDREIALSLKKFHEKGVAVQGFRAPAFKINKYTLQSIKKWFKYDSSSINFFVKIGRYTGMYTNVYADDDITYIPVTNIGKFRIPFGSPYLLALGPRIRKILFRYFSQVNVAVFYCHCWDLIPLEYKLLSSRSFVKRFLYFDQCGTIMAHDFYDRLLSTVIEMGFEIITCSRLCKIVKERELV